MGCSIRSKTSLRAPGHLDIVSGFYNYENYYFSLKGPTQDWPFVVRLSPVEIHR